MVSWSGKHECYQHRFSIFIWFFSQFRDFSFRKFKFWIIHHFGDHQGWRLPFHGGLSWSHLTLPGKIIKKHFNFINVLNSYKWFSYDTRISKRFLPWKISWKLNYRLIFFLKNFEASVVFTQICEQRLNINLSIHS